MPIKFKIIMCNSDRGMLNQFRCCHPEMELLIKILKKWKNRIRLFFFDFINFFAKSQYISILLLFISPLSLFYISNDQIDFLS